jgi:hypothetical protein
MTSMPSSTHKPASTTSSRARSTSIGPTRRGPQKAHIPFRADDLEHGKKTGIEVAYVDHNSDEFEPFSEIMGQADGRTPVGAGKRGRKSGQRREQEDGDRDEEGEISMELDQSMFVVHYLFAYTHIECRRSFPPCVLYRYPKPQSNPQSPLITSRLHPCPRPVVLASDRALIRCRL